MDGALDEKVENTAASLSDLELKPSSGSSDLLISGALKDENNKPDDLGDLFEDDRNIDADLSILGTQKYISPEESQKSKTGLCSQYKTSIKQKL